MSRFPSVAIIVISLWAMAPAIAQAPPLKPGEAFLTLDGDGKLQAWGDVKTPRPLGEMAKLVWLQIAGADWASLDVYWDCRNPACQPPKGHGRVDLKKAFREDCDDAFLFWAEWERKDWIEHQGEGITRMQLMATFAPFLGNRVPEDGPLPEFTPEWVGRGDLLQASPAQFLAWLGNQDNQGVLTMSREFMGGFLAFAFEKQKWWFKPGVCSQGTWVLGGNGRSEALLFISMPETPKEAIRRMKDILGAAKK